jgi:hypothetical protein
VAAGVVDPLEVVQVAHDQADGLATYPGLLFELLHSGREGLSVEHPGKRIDHGGTAVVKIRAHQGDREDGDREDQHRRGRDGGGIIEHGARVHPEGGGEQQREGDRNADHHPAHREARGQGDDRDREPGDCRAVGTAAEHDADCDHHLGACPGREHHVLGALRAHRVGVREPEEAQCNGHANQRRDENQGPDEGRRGQQRDHDHGHRRHSHRPQVVLHVEQPLAVEIVTA